MDRNKELTEAKAAARRVISLIDDALAQTKKASGLGVWDILGGGLFVSAAKRQSISKINVKMDLLAEGLRDLGKELKDLSLTLPIGPSDL